MGTGDIEQSRQIIRWLTQRTHLESLFKNSEATAKWESYKKEHEELLPRLEQFRKDLKVDVMVPLGKKALMPGKLVHTNEILISLGGGWFIKQSAERAAELCKRRVKKCEEFLDKLSKERGLLESRLNFSAMGHEVFPDEGIQEIVEPLDEEKEKEWRRNHQKSLEESHAREMSQRRENIDKDEEATDAAWRRLEELALQEELDCELDRAGITEQDLGQEASELDSDDESDPEVEPPLDNTSVITRPTLDPIKEVVAVRTPEMAMKTVAAVDDDSTKKISRFKAARMKK